MPIPPVPGTISHKFGEDRRTRRHNGVDYKFDNSGTDVKAGADGIVVRSTKHEPREVIFTYRTGNKTRTEKEFTGSYGNVIILYHGQDIKTRKFTYTIYAHLDKRTVNKNEEVKQGQVIGTIGRSGTKQGFYNKKGGFELHFEVLESLKELKWVKGGPLDFRCTSETWRIDPECFLGRPFGVSSRLPVPYYKLPVGLDFKKNIKEVKKMNIIPDDKIYSIRSSNMTLKIIETLLEGSLFANTFRREGKWNMRHTYKNSGLTREELTNLGNYNFGLTGAAAGYSSRVLHLAGAMDQYFEGKQKDDYSSIPIIPADNPDDTFWINRGIEDYKADRWKQGASGCV